MSLYIQRNMIVPAEHAPLARSLAYHLAGPPGDGMWVVGLSEDGNEPATHYVSSGPVGAEFGPMLTDATALHAAVTAATDAGMQVPQGTGLTLADCEALVRDTDVSGMPVIVETEDGPVEVVEGPFDAFARLGLKLVEPSFT